MERYPPIEPYRHGYLNTGDGHELYWEECGNPDGKPAVVLHGGPGSGCVPGLRRYFDPGVYRVVLFDQRGCGRSRPHASLPTTSLETNTTTHLLADLELLRTTLDIESWLLFGGSWGAVLALAYAVRHAEHVSQMVFTGVATGRRAETDLLTRGLGKIFPDAWARFVAGVPEQEREGDLSAAYARRLAHEDPAVREQAALDWCDWESAIVPTAHPGPAFADAGYRMTFARIVTHYFANGSWLDDQPVLAEAHRFAHIPGVVVQGTLDFNNLVGTPWLLAQAWPGCELVLVDSAGHDTSGGVVDALLRATNRFARW